MNTFWGSEGNLYPAPSAQLFDGPAYARVHVNASTALVDVVRVTDGDVLYSRTF